MNQAELEQIARDAAGVFTGLRFGKVFPLGRSSLAIDFFPHSGEYLYVNCDPKRRSCYLITRRLKDLERSSTHATPFVINMRKLLSGSEVRCIEALPDADRVIVVEFELTEDPAQKLVLQLGGKRPNIFILADDDTITDAFNDTGPADPGPGQTYVAPSRQAADDAVRETGERALSAVLDEAETALADQAELEKLANTARRKLNADIAKRRKLVKNLEGDLAAQGNADEWKRFGDLILANIANIRREEDAVIVTDYFDPEQPEIAIPVKRDVSPTEAAESFFRRYTKARNGAAEIAKRMEIIAAEIEKLDAELSRVDAAIDRKDIAYLSGFIPDTKQVVPQKRKRETTDEYKGVRRFVSTDGFEILVGKKAKDNDHLTFRIAKSLDHWFHAADYPGSHVVVRTPDKRELPVQTLTEAAQVAAFYSDAREQPKAAVHYTQKKFVNKPKRAAPGLVSLASFKTILVEPKIAVRARET